MKTTFLTTAIPHTEAAALISGAAPVTRGIFDKLLPELQSRAFTVTGVECVKTLERVRDLTAKLPIGGDWDDLKSQILSEISPWLITSEDAEEAAKQAASAIRRAELILRNNGWAAYATTNHRTMDEMADIFPFAEYVSSEDARVRPGHAALNGKIFPTKDPFWNTHTPPWEHGCRCDKVPRLAEDIDDLREEEKTLLPENRKVMEGAALEQTRQGRLALPNATGFLDIRTPRQKNGTGYEFNPNTLALSYEDILDGYPATAAQAFRTWAKTIDINGTPLSTLLGAIPENIPALPVAAIAQKINTIPANTIPVSQSLSPKGKVTKDQEATLNEGLAFVDRTHGDGSLLNMPVIWGKKNSGHYAYGREIKIGALADSQISQLIHEIGHKIDREGIPSTRELYASEDKSSILAGVMNEIKKSQAVTKLKTDPLYKRDSKYKKYQLSPVELWARAYYQFIAEETQDPHMLEVIASRRAGHTGYWADSQWDSQDFAPIRAAIKSAFIRLGWIEDTSNQPTP